MDVRAPVFVLAPPRSCTSIICAMLGQHAELHALPEVNLMAADSIGELLDLFVDRPGLGHGVLRAVAELGLGGQTDADVSAASEWLQDHRDLGVDGLYRDLGAFAAPRRLVDKSPLHVMRDDTLERMRRLFPDAHYLHLVREPSAVCTSYFRFRDRLRKLSSRGPRQGERLVDADQPDQIWLQPHQRILAHLAAVPADRQFRVQAEAVLADPEVAMREVAGWLGLRTDVNSIAAMLHPERSPYACLGPPAAMFGNDPEFLRNPALRTPARRAPNSADSVTLSDETRALATELGYA